MRVWHGTRQHAGRDDAGDVGHVDEEQGADVVCDGPLRVVDPRGYELPPATMSLGWCSRARSRTSS